MSQPQNGQTLVRREDRLLAPAGAQDRFTAERVLRTRPKTYRAIVQLDAIFRRLATRDGDAP
jgi:hypothetical protein